MSDLKLIIAHTIIEDLRAQHPGIEQIDNERGDVWLPGGSTPQSAGCVVDIHSMAQSVEQAVLAALRPEHTDLMVTPESIDAFLAENPPPAAPVSPDSDLLKEAVGRIKRLEDILAVLGNEAADAIDANDLNLIRKTTLDTALYVLNNKDQG